MPVTNTRIMAGSGVGVGMRPPHYSQFLRGEVAPAGWIEVNAERYVPLPTGANDAHLQVLRFVRGRMPVVIHGTSMSLGSVDGYNEAYVENLRELCAIIEPELVSDHLCWSGTNGIHLHDLLPLPFTEECIDVVTSNIDAVQGVLKRPILVENVSSYMQCDFHEMSEWEFISEVVRRSGCYLLLDINNVHVSGTNHGWDPHEFLRRIPHERVRQIHLAGYSNRNGLLVDTHGAAVTEPVWNLFEWYIRTYGPVPSMIERDSQIPPWKELAAELETIRSIVERGHRGGEVKCA